MRVLLCAFEPFGGQTLNASQQVAREVERLPLLGGSIEVLELPVERLRAPLLVIGAVERLRPDIIILLGEAGGRASITPERVAINVDDFSIPDNARNQPREEPIIDQGPAAYFSTLPLVAIREALQQEGVPAAISNTAGTYVCNHVFYRVMHHLAQSRSSVPAGFIHIPLLPEQTAPANCPTLNRETAVKGVRIAVQTCLYWRGC